MPVEARSAVAVAFPYHVTVEGIIHREGRRTADRAGRAILVPCKGSQPGEAGRSRGPGGPRPTTRSRPGQGAARSTWPISSVSP